jgi:predicted transcriptional regulator
MANAIRYRQKIVADMMSSPVVTVSDTDTFKHVIEVLQNARVSAVPVVAAGHVLDTVCHALLRAIRSSREAT